MGIFQKLRVHFLFVAMLILPLAGSLAFHASPLGCTRSSHCADHARTSSLRAAHWMDVLKFGGTTPPFDVIQKTQEFVGSRAERAEEFFADDYVFRGSIIGPMSNAEVRETQKVRRSYKNERAAPLVILRTPALAVACACTRSQAVAFLLSLSLWWGGGEGG